MDFGAYLERIGAHRDDPLDVLMARHLDTVPFENLSVHLRETIDLHPDALLDKIVRRRRGGFCYELNGAFALLLEHLGFEVHRLACRVATGGGYSFPGDHLALDVRRDGRRALVDVGFGRFAAGPLDLDRRDPQADRVGTFTVRDGDGDGDGDGSDGDLDVDWDGRAQYRVETRPRALDDLVPLAWWHATSPGSAFTRELLATRLTSSERVTLSGTRLIRTPDVGQRTELTLEPGEVLPAYRTWFGLELDRLPAVLHPTAH